MVIIETKIFTRIIKELMTDDQYKELQEALVSRPDLGDLIKDSGGLRKVRWNLQNRGKRVVFALSITGLLMITTFACCMRTPKAGRKTSLVSNWHSSKR